MAEISGTKPLISQIPLLLGPSHGVMSSIDCIAVENQIPRNMYERSALDDLICNAPMEYVDLILSGEVFDYLRRYTDDSRLD